MSRVSNAELLICGDLHGKFRHVIQAAEQRLPAAVVLVSDIEAPSSAMFDEFIRDIESLGADLFFVHGNHDTDQEASWRAITSDFAKERNINGRVMTLKNGTRG
jgi:predicted phosphodiesterase